MAAVALQMTGPGWTVVSADDPTDTGRNPLAVEAAVYQHALTLVPGVVTATPHARYLALHTRLAFEARSRTWTDPDDLDAFRTLLRKCEALLGVISVAHARAKRAHSQQAGPSVPHGQRVINRHLDTGPVDLEALAAEYSKVTFLPTYQGSEALLGLTDGTRIPAPAAKADPAALHVFDELIGLAQRETLVLRNADLAKLRHLCLCEVTGAPDGAMLREAFFGGNTETAAVHRRSAALLLEALIGTDVADPLDTAMERLCCFDPRLTDRLGGDEGLIHHALAWRGALLRNWSVWSWRYLWARLVEPLKDRAMTIDDVTALFARGLPVGTVRAELDAALPPLTDATGTPLPIEHDIFDSSPADGSWLKPDALRLLQLLAVGARRIAELDPVARAAFLGDSTDDLGPIHVASWLAQAAQQPLPEAVADLGRRLFTRAEAISRRKMQWTSSGRLRLPTRLRRDGDRYRLEGTEGDGATSLPLQAFRSVMQQLGVITDNGGVWTVGPYAAELRP